MIMKYRINFLMVMSSIIGSNPKILCGEPVVKGMRVPVDLIYELVELNYSIEYILNQCPSLTRDALVGYLVGRFTEKMMITRLISQPSRRDEYYLLQYLPDRQDRAT